jgi:hypothetical protein
LLSHKLFFLVSKNVSNTLRVFENRVLRRIFRPKNGKATGGWRKLHNKELHNLYASQNIIRVIKSSTVRLVEHVECMGR